MNTMTPADILTATIAAVGIYVAYRIVMWLADRAIDCINDITRHER